MNSLKNSLIVRKNRLTDAQKHLYALICVKVSNDEKITIEDIRSLYINYVNRNVIDGIPHYCDYFADKHVYSDGSTGYSSRLKPMEDWRVEHASTLWLVNNLGKLVLKGLLNVIPQIELKKLESGNLYD